MKRTVNILAAIFALIGLVASCYLVLEHYGLVRQQSALLAEACPIQEGVCTAVTESPDLAVLGIPYSVLGGAYFLFIFTISMVKLQTGKWLFPRMLLMMLTISLVFSAYLLYVMLHVLGKVCPYCLAAHAANAAFFVVYCVSLSEDAADYRRSLAHSAL